MAPKPVRCAAPDCGRILRSPKSIEDRLSKRCKARLNATRLAMDSALEGLSPAQKDKALALISAGGVRATNRPGVYRVASSDGVTTYLTTEDMCGCKFASLGRLCAHEGSVRAVEAARAAMTMRKAA